MFCSPIVRTGSKRKVRTSTHNLSYVCNENTVSANVELMRLRKESQGQSILRRLNKRRTCKHQRRGNKEMFI